MENTTLLILVGLGAFILGNIFSSIKSYFKIKKLNKEILDNETYLNRHLKINAEGNKKLEEELIQIRSENENLRISVQTLGQKPGNAEIRLLNIYDVSIRKVSAQVPGFSSVWEKSLQETEIEFSAADKGFKLILNKVFNRNKPDYSENTVKALSNLK